jgi:hypothetical protein
MVALIVALLSVVLPLVHLAFSESRSRRRVIYLLLLYALVLDVGVMGVFIGLISHVFFADQTAESIGWQPGSPFQFDIMYSHKGSESALEIFPSRPPLSYTA